MAAWNKGLAVIDLTRPTAQFSILRKMALITVCLYLILLTYLSLVPVVPGEPDVSDKLLHFIAYGGLTGLAAAAWPRLKIIYLFFGVSFVGALLEFGQGVLNIGRMASFADQIANMSGAALALAIWIIIVFFGRALKIR